MRTETPEFDRDRIEERVIAGLVDSGPASLMDLYRLCGASDGGQQHFVRQTLIRMSQDCKIRRDGENYSVGARTVTSAVRGAPSRPRPKPVKAVAPPDPPPDAADGTAAQTDETEDVADEGVLPPSAGVVPTRAMMTDDDKEEKMQTQSRKSAGRNIRNGHAAEEEKPTSKVDWVYAAVAETGTANFSDLFRRAVKEGVFKEAPQLGSALTSLVRRKKLKRAGRGVYVIPDAKVVFDATRPKKGVAPKRTAADVKKADEERKSRKSEPKKRGKPGRKPSPLRGFYDEFDGKIADAVRTEKEAKASIREIDGQQKALKARRAELVSQETGARAAAKKLREGRAKLSELEAGLNGLLKG